MRTLPLFAAVLTAATALSAAAQSTPDLGPNVRVFAPTDDMAKDQAEINRIYAAQQHSEFGTGRYALLFMPGTYHLDIPIGFYTEVRGLGISPDQVQIIGNVHADASLPNNNATCTFWRSVENFSVTPTGGTMQWAVSQAAPMRAMHIHGNLVLHQNHGWASGGWISDSVIDGTVDSGSQQQFITRNSSFKNWTGANWNIVFVADKGAPATAWPEPGYTTVDRAPLVRRKPFPVVSGAGHWSVDVPHADADLGAPGTAYAYDGPPNALLALDGFYIARADRDTAATLNRALSSGKNLLFTPGIYALDAPLDVWRAGTVVLGLGFATLRPTGGTAAILAEDPGNITLAGLLIDAGPTPSPVLVRVGEPGGSHAAQGGGDLLSDLFFREGGADVGKAVVNLEVNSSHTIIDHTWIWRADHGAHVGWDDNTSDTGLIVNGSDVTAYGLFVEHHEKYQVIWNGERGRTYMYQSELPYDPPNQAAWKSPTGNGWASYKVADNVRDHQAWGLGVYSVFTYPNIVLDHAIETPTASGVHFTDMITTCLNKLGAIENIVDTKGGAATCQPRHWPRLAQFP